MEIVAYLGIGFVSDAVAYLAWIILDVIKFIGIHQMKGQLVALSGCSTHHLKTPKAIMIHLVAGKFGKYHIVDLSGGVVDLRKHALPCKGFRKLLTKIIHNGRSQIDMRGWILNHFTLLTATDEQWNIGYFPVNGGIFLVQMVGAQHRTMIRGVDHQRIRHFLIDDF